MRKTSRNILETSTTCEPGPEMQECHAEAGIGVSACRAGFLMHAATVKVMRDELEADMQSSALSE